MIKKLIWFFSLVGRYALFNGECLAPAHIYNQYFMDKDYVSWRIVKRISSSYIWKMLVNLRHERSLSYMQWPPSLSSWFMIYWIKLQRHADTSLQYNTPFWSKHVWRQKKIMFCYYCRIYFHKIFMCMLFLCSLQPREHACPRTSGPFC